ncbi:MFS transporter [bacterium M00.F.Ca.ET.159.01.1.1]|nr:MFS transporter [bacterium M00.F.Ca.ET.159.01.1.1]TGT87790.1 MFS transporter [bacterium M00.F.Ca.ET.157.01.1.1]
MPSWAASARVEGSTTPGRRLPARICASSPRRTWCPRLSLPCRSISSAKSAVKLDNNSITKLVMFLVPVARYTVARHPRRRSDMAVTAVTIHSDRDAGEPIFTAATLGMAGVMFSAMSSFYLLLSAIAAHAASLGGADAAGHATGALMAATIGGEIAAPRIIAAFGRKMSLVMALGLLGTACLLAFPSSLALLLLNCLVRGVALGVLLVAASGISAKLAPPSRRTEAMSLYGVASAVPAILAVPLGPWVLSHLGPSATALGGSGLGVIALAATAILPVDISRDDDGDNRMPAWRLVAIPATSLACGAILVGAAVTILPLAHPEASSGAIMLGLLAQGAGATFTRWASARHVDRHGPKVPTGAGLASCALAAVCLALPSQAAMLTGMLLSGMAFGVLQSATVADVLSRAAPSQRDGAGALWNVAYDAGLGIGGLAVAALATSVGFSAAFAATAALFALVMLFALKPNGRIA